MLMISGPVRRTGPDGYTSLYYMVGKMGQNQMYNAFVLSLVLSFFPNSLHFLSFFPFPTHFFRGFEFALRRNRLRAFLP